MLIARRKRDWSYDYLAGLLTTVDAVRIKDPLAGVQYRAALLERAMLKNWPGDAIVRDEQAITGPELLSEVEGAIRKFEEKGLTTSARESFRVKVALLDDWSN